MKKELSYVIVVGIIFLVAACSGSQKETAAEVEVVDESEWPMMDEFHMIMAESFHPFKDSANLAPAIANAQEMANVAERWSTSALPSKVDNESVKATLEMLKTETAAFAQLVQSNDEAAIGSALTNLHDLFHKIQEAWYGDHDHQH